MRRIHLIIGLLGVMAFLLTGQAMKHHNPPMHSLAPEVRMMYVSRHIYLLGAVLVNVALGIYFQMRPVGWRRALQHVGSLLILFSIVALLVAFMEEPALGMAGRSWQSYLGLIALFAGVMTQFVASLGAKPN
jgi:hypothetical protein